MKRNLLQYEQGGRVHVSLVYDSRTVAYLARRRTSTSIAGKDAVIARGRANLEQMQRDLDRKARDLREPGGRGSAREGLSVRFLGMLGGMTVVHLAGNGSSFVTGAELVVEGGYLAR
jgi:hypothetical protein